MRRTVYGSLLSSLLCSATLAAPQLPSWMGLQGYVQDLQTIVITESQSTWNTGVVTQNRLELSIYPTATFTIASALRTRLMYGKLYEQLIAFGYDDIVNEDPGLVDLSCNAWSNQSSVLNATIDRLYLDFSPGSWQFRIGRQRINWGKNLVWNPNDIFNAYSVFDVSYPEGPGVDALVIRRFLGPLSHGELAVAGASDLDSVAAAFLVQVNRWGFDMQVLGGWVRHHLAGGAGFSGQVGNAAVRGEGSVFIPDTMGTRAQAVISLSADYTFQFKLYAQAGGLLNTKGSTRASGTGITSLFSSRLTAEDLSPARWQVFVQASYPFTPLIRTDWSAVINPEDGSAILIPAFSFSLSDNVETTLQGQVQMGERGDQFGGTEHAVYASVRWSF